MDRYDKGNAPLDMDFLIGRPCYGGLDLASTDDIAAFVLVFPPGDMGEKYYVLPFFWIPEENLKRRVQQHHVPYDVWEKQGYLNATEGNIIYYDFIEQQIIELRKLYDIREICYDRWGAGQLSQHLRRENFEMIDFGQGFKSMSQPSKELHRLVLDERLMHGGNPVLRWMFENVYIETDAASNIKPSKKKSREKIDGAVATIMALDRAILREDTRTHGGLAVYDYDSDTLYRNGEQINQSENPAVDVEVQRRKEHKALFEDDW